jgi:hypothetical protein
MSIAGVQLIYRLRDTIRLLIDYRGTPVVPDTFNFYWSSTSGGVYNLFVSGIKNEPSHEPAIRGKINFDFLSSTIVGWDNFKTNYIKMSSVTGGIEGALEGPMTIPSREEMITFADKQLIFGYNRDEDRFIPLAVDPNGKLITA